MTPSELGIIGAPTSAAAHFIGQEQGPDHFRRNGLLSKLVEHGFDPIDLGDLPHTPFEPDPNSRGLRSVPRVADFARQVAGSVAIAASSGLRTIIAGGDCSITVGVVSGLARMRERVGVAYLDGHFDLNTVE
ncbi:MAG: arginase family protein, partial [Chloroflexota bacterium]